jgi:hypothetical protein
VIVTVWAITLPLPPPASTKRIATRAPGRASPSAETLSGFHSE